MAYEIREHDLDGGRTMKVLAPVGSKSFIEKLIESPKKSQRLIKIARLVERIETNGVDWAITAKKLKVLDDDLALYELVVGNTTIRLMSYLHEKAIAIYLFDFEGHQGKTSQIPSHYIERGKELAAIARECVRSEEGNHG